MGINATRTFVYGEPGPDFSIKVKLHPVAARGYEFAMRMIGDAATIGTGGYALPKGAILARCVSLSGGNYLEIGSQYGLSAVIAAHFTDGHIYCIDPMEKVMEDESTAYGYLDRGAQAHTGERVIFDRNMRFFGIEDRVTLMEDFSDPFPLSPQVEIGTAYIDGDHSYAMVKKDFFNIYEQVTDYIILDDFQKETGVDQALPEILSEQSDFKLALAVQKVAVLARVGVDQQVGFW